MWIQLSEKDAIAARRERLKNINKVTAALTVVPIVILSVIGYFGFIYIKWTGRFFGQMDGLVVGSLLGIFVGWWLGSGYKFTSMRDLDAMAVCVRCGSKKHNNNSNVCPCGGSYIPILSARWREADREIKTDN